MTSSPSDTSAHLPRSVARALRELLGPDVRRAEPLHNDEPWLPYVRTFVIDLDDGQRLKARFVEQRGRAAASASLTRLLDDPRLPAPTAQIGSVTIDAWVPGETLATLGWHAGELAAAAELLATLHTFAGGPHEHLPHERRTSHLAEGAVAALLAPARDGSLDAAMADEVVGVLRESLPERARWGVSHGDFAPVNLVLTLDGQLISIDNERVHRGFLDLDLARSWYRWPLPETEQAHFDTAYCAAVGFHQDKDARRAWRVLAAAKKVSLRHSRGSPTAVAVTRLKDALAGVDVVGAPVSRRRAAQSRSRSLDGPR
jgi:hypothetical protein